LRDQFYRRPALRPFPERPSGVRIEAGGRHLIAWLREISAQHLAHDCGARWPPVRLLFQELKGDLRQLGRDVRGVNQQSERSLVEMLVREPVAREWRAPCQQLVQNTAQSIEVGLGSDLAFEDLLRSLVPATAHRRPMPGVGSRVPTDRLGDSEVDEDDSAIPRDK
jgi:hypothetical protein